MKPNYSNLSFKQLLNKINYFDLPNKSKELFSRLEPKYKVYTALLSQSGTDAPVATVLENTLGDIVWTRSTEGTYIGTLSNAFMENKTFLNVSCSGQNNDMVINGNRVDSNNVTIGIYLLNIPDVIDKLDSMLEASIEIRVYN